MFPAVPLPNKARCMGFNASASSDATAPFAPLAAGTLMPAAATVVVAAAAADAEEEVAAKDELDADAIDDDAAVPPSLALPCARRTFFASSK